jgi:phosphatidylglycerophosphatase A
MGRRAPLPPLNTGPALLSTWFGAGRLPFAPGTWGSLAALPFAAFLDWLGGPWLLVAGCAVLFVAGVWATSQYLRVRGGTDPQDVVIDEVIGMSIALIGAPLELRDYALAVVLFRAFDILKPGPVAWVERRAPGAYGVVLDDVVSGLFALLVLVAVRWIAA